MWNIGVLKYGKAGLKSSAPHTVSIQRPVNRVAVLQNARRFHGTVFRDEQDWEQFCSADARIFGAP